MLRRIVITVFYDGTCGLCHRAVQFLLARDPNGVRFRYAPLQGQTAAERLGSIDDLPDSMVVQCADGSRLMRGRAAVHLGRELGGFWWLLATTVGLLPTGFVNWLYDQIARRRYRWFGRETDHCPLLPPEQRALFLD